MYKLIPVTVQVACELLIDDIEKFDPQEDEPLERDSRVLMRAQANVREAIENAVRCARDEGFHNEAGHETVINIVSIAVAPEGEETEREGEKVGSIDVALMGQQACTIGNLMEAATDPEVKEHLTGVWNGLHAVLGACRRGGKEDKGWLVVH